MDEFRIDQELFRPIPADLMLRYGFVPCRRDGNAARHRRLRPDRPADDRRAQRRARARRSRSRSARRRRSSRSSRRARARSASSRSATEGLPAAGPQRGQERRREPHRRAADERHQPDHPAGRLDDLHRHPAAGERHPHRDRRRRGARQVPHRRRAAAGDAADRQAAPQRHHLAHQGDGRARHRREARAAGRPLQGAHAGQDDRLPRLDHAERARRRRRDPHSRQGVDQRAVHRAEARHPRLPGAGAEALPQVHPRAVRDGAGDRADRLGQDDHALRRAVRDQDRSKTRSSPSKTRSSTSCKRHHPDSRSTRRRG